MQNLTKTDDAPIEELIRLIGQRAGNIFLTHQLWCSGAALLALNQGLSGDLTQGQVIRLAAGLGDGLAGSGCLCGGLNGAALALGLFLSPGKLTTRGETIVLGATGKLHDQFKAAFGSACCRTLIKGLRIGSHEHFHLCAHRTSLAASQAAELILQHKPELIQQVDWGFLECKETTIGVYAKRIAKRPANK